MRFNSFSHTTEMYSIIDFVVFFHQTFRGFFEGASCKPFINIEPAGNTCWYLTFPTEEDSNEAFRHLTSNAKYKGQSVKVRVVSK